MSNIIKITPQVIDVEKLVDKLEPAIYYNMNELLSIYNMSESIRLNMWSMIKYLQRDLEVTLPMKPTEKIINAYALVEEDGVLKIVIEDFLPSRSFVESKDERQLLQNHWISAIRDAIDELDKTKSNMRFDPAFCQIVTYVPRNADYEPNNRVYNFIIDGLKYSGILISNWDKMAFMVVGRVDKNYPRTEVYVSQPGQDLTNFIRV